MRLSEKENKMKAKAINVEAHLSTLKGQLKAVEAQVTESISDRDIILKEKRTAEDDRDKALRDTLKQVKYLENEQHKIDTAKDKLDKTIEQFETKKTLANDAIAAREELMSSKEEKHEVYMGVIRTRAKDLEQGYEELSSSYEDMEERYSVAIESFDVEIERRNKELIGIEGSLEDVTAARSRYSDELAQTKKEIVEAEKELSEAIEQRQTLLNNLTTREKDVTNREKDIKVLIRRAEKWYKENYPDYKFKI